VIRKEHGPEVAVASLGSGSDQAEGMVDVFHCGVGAVRPVSGSGAAPCPGARHARTDGALEVAHMKNWRILTKLRLHVRHATTLLRALLVNNIEIAR
jgi:hypothetical protein